MVSKSWERRGIVACGHAAGLATWPAMNGRRSLLRMAEKLVVNVGLLFYRHICPRDLCAYCEQKNSKESQEKAQTSRPHLSVVVIEEEITTNIPNPFLPLNSW